MKKNYIRSPLLLASMLTLTLCVLGMFAFNTSSPLASTEFESDKLYRDIKEYNDKHQVAPIDAKVDPIWKAISGYNGLTVDIVASYQWMEKSGEFNSNKIVYKEVAPSVHLKALNLEPIYRGNPEKPMVSFLINVAWGNEYLPKILQTLSDYNVHATFFLDGSWVSKHPDLASTIYSAGHEIGNHAYSHPDLKNRSEGETIKELSKTNDVIKETLNLTPKWFAPPSGSFNETTIRVADRLNMKTILWTVDTVDWKKPETAEMVERVVGKVENGSMILMHPTKPVAEGLEAMITKITEQGYELGSVSELLNEARIDPGSPQMIDKGFFIN